MLLAMFSHQILEHFPHRVDSYNARKMKEQ